MGRFSNLKSRLMLLVLIALAPVVLLILYSDVRYRRSIETDARDNLSSLNFLAKDNLNKFFDTTRLLLITLSQTAEVQKGSYASISAFLRNLHKHYPNYVNIGMADLKGNLVCSALPLTRQINSSDLFWFQQAVRTRDFSIGEYQIGRIAGMPVMVISRPIFDKKGKMKAVLYLSIKLDWLKRLVTDINLPEGYAFVITDRKGTILSRHPDPDKWTGKLIPEAQLIKAVLSQKNGIAEITGLDGMTRMYAFSTAGYGVNHIYVAVGMSKAAAFKEINQILLIDLLLLIAMGVVGLVMARLFGNVLILRPVNALKNAAENLSRGNFSARMGYADRTDELGSLAGIFDNMAEAVEKEISLRTKAQEELHEKTEELDSYFNNALDLFCIADTDGYFRRVNKEWEKTLGFKLEELEGQRFLDFVHPDDMESTLEAVSRLEAQEEVLNFENRYRCKDGSYRWIEWRSTSSGKLIYAAARDITGRKRDESILAAEAQVLEMISTGAPLSAVLEMIVLNIEALSQDTIASILLLDPDGLHVHYGAAPGLPEAYNLALEGAAIGPNAGSCGTAAYRREPVIVSDIETDPLWTDYCELAKMHGLRACWSTPIMNSEGAVLGTFAMYYRTQRSPKEEDFRLIARATHTAGIAIERKQAEEEIRIINEELIAINRIITAITGVSNTKEILEKVLDEALDITGLEGGTICMVTPRNTLQLAAHRATSEATILDLTTNEIRVGDCLCGECARDHKPLILWDCEAVLKFATRGEDIRFHAAFPLIVVGRCLGVLCVFTRTDNKPQERRLKLLEMVTSQIALAVQNAGLFEETLRSSAILEDRVKERTAELEEKIAEIERMNRLFVGRELRMKELKEIIKELEKRVG